MTTFCVCPFRYVPAQQNDVSIQLKCILILKSIVFWGKHISCTTKQLSIHTDKMDCIFFFFSWGKSISLNTKDLTIQKTDKFPLSRLTWEVMAQNCNKWCQQEIIISFVFPLSCCFWCFHISFQLSVWLGLDNQATWLVFGKDHHFGWNTWFPNLNLMRSLSFIFCFTKPTNPTQLLIWWASAAEVNHNQMGLPA